jgi:glycosyltransferase involved in cell wall biosynthesis
MGSTVAASVIMTVYNGGTFLSTAIESIRKQTVTDLEFVIVDDGSTDNTANILAHAQKDSRLKVITSKRLGRARALNLAWNTARGDFIANLDSDDLAEPDRIEKQVHFLQRHPEVGLLGTAWNFFLNDDYQNVRVYRPPLSSEELKSALIRYYPFSHSSTMFTRRALAQAHGYNESYHVCLDYEISTRIARCWEIANLSDVLTWKRSNLTSFFSAISAWERYKAVIGIRWMAWSAFSRRLNELPHVINGWGILKEAVGKSLYDLDARSIRLKSEPK